MAIQQLTQVEMSEVSGALFGGLPILGGQNVLGGGTGALTGLLGAGNVLPNLGSILSVVFGTLGSELNAYTAGLISF
jgi:hypothetical protein